jgi:hypothetical protein
MRMVPFGLQDMTRLAAAPAAPLMPLLLLVCRQKKSSCESLRPSFELTLNPSTGNGTALTASGPRRLDYCHEQKAAPRLPRLSRSYLPHTGRGPSSPRRAPMTIPLSFKQIDEKIALLSGGISSYGLHL